jgi:hypothetical protein
LISVIHNYSNAAGKTLYWDTSDSEQAYSRNIKDPEKQQKLIDLGFFNNSIEYKFNSHGFRTAEFDQKIDAVCFGCSFTMGTGVQAADSWPQQLQTLAGLQVANLGHAGSSNDTVFRFADHYLKLLQPKYAIWMQTDMHRLELLDDYIPLSLNILSGDTTNPCSRDYFIKTWFSCNSNQQLNLKKNTLAFEQLCGSLNIRPIVIPRQMLMSDGCARDLMHPGVKVYTSLAKQIITLLGQ